VTDAIQIIQGARKILGAHNIRLHKLASSHPEVTAAFPSTELATSNLTTDDENLTEFKTLGIAWSRANDTLNLSPNLPNRPFTKRGILSVVNGLYDPFGMASPVALSGRLVQRRVLPPKSNSTPDLDRCGWDDPLPVDYLTEWTDWTSSLSHIHLLTIPRCHRPPNFGVPRRRELHCFCDASLQAVGHVIYIRQINDCNDVAVSFVFSNSKVAPRSATTVPRLELCAAMEAARDANRVVHELEVPIDLVNFYTDSMIVLHYLQNNTKRFSLYVTRRISETLKYSNVSQWRHIDGLSNVGDLASRPQTIKQLLNSEWLLGPGFLHDKYISLTPSKCLPVEHLPEVRNNATRVNSPEQDSLVAGVLLRISRWLRVVAVLKKVLTFIDLLKRNERKDVTDRACRVLYRNAQFAFSTEISMIGNGDPLPDGSLLSSLSPVIDPHGIIRVGGRLGDSHFQGTLNIPLFYLRIMK